ncbi:MAG TPA: hypothetical protein VFI02_06175 [Armatimonadota bacterium]|nr:hypothetical protein [Armatimonadota bacterium]
MRLIDVLDSKDIEQIGQQLRGLLDGGYVSRALAEAVTSLLDGRRIRLSGGIDKYSFDVSIWIEDRKRSL